MERAKYKTFAFIGLFFGLNAMATDVVSIKEGQSVMVTTKPTSLPLQKLNTNCLIQF
jgi:hypothetical protein